MQIHPALRGTTWSSGLPAVGQHLDADRLAGIVSALASRADLWRDLVRHDPHRRWYRRVALTDAVDVWLIGWCPGQSTPLHDHGGASGAVAVVGGSLVEVVVPSPPGAVRSQTLHRGALLRVPPDTVHRVGNDHRLVLATSIHAYSPPGLDLTEYAPEAALIGVASSTGEAAVAGARR
jgi:predicted metal-dependent enzyme (double-stranded beta helix superfamily)